MPAMSAGLLPYRFGQDGILEVLLVHPGGPFWAGRDDGAWSIAKGEYEPDEDPETAAEREFAEELGQSAPRGQRIDIGEIRQPSGKRVRAWAVEGDVDAEHIASNEFEMEWPPRSGRKAWWPEVDRAAWLPVLEARRKLLKGQVAFVDRLVQYLGDQPEGDISPTL
ncbi:MAG: NUDIX domain-containing protein [Acidimicrobiales bacterium]